MNWLNPKWLKLLPLLMQVFRSPERAHRELTRMRDQRYQQELDRLERIRRERGE